LLALAVAHLLPPVDLVPEVLVPEVLLGLLGRTDDALVALRPGGAVRCETGRYLGRERTQPTVIDQPPTRWRRSPARPPATWYTSQRERASAGGTIGTALRSVSERQRADHRHSAPRSARPGAAGERA
jgi:hypothetical protein